MSACAKQRSLSSREADRTHRRKHRGRRCSARSSIASMFPLRHPQPVLSKVPFQSSLVKSQARSRRPCAFQSGNEIGRTEADAAFSATSQVVSPDLSSRIRPPSREVWVHPGYPPTVASRCMRRCVCQRDSDFAKRSVGADQLLREVHLFQAFPEPLPLLACCGRSDLQLTCDLLVGEVFQDAESE